MSDETSEIENKKKENENNDGGDKMSISGFINTLITIIVLLLILFFSGTMLLYSCKVAQSNILPTEKDCFPFSSTLSEIKEIPVNINVTTVGDEIQSEKVIFSYSEDSKKNSLLDYLFKQTKAPKQSAFVMFFISLLQDSFLFNYKLVNSLLNTINKTFSETFILLLVPMIVPFLVTIFILMNWFSFSYSWFSKLEWLFKKNTNTEKDKPPHWEDITFSEPINYGFAVFFAFCLIILYFGLLFIPIPLITPIVFCIFLIAYFSPLFITGKKQPDGSEYSFSQSIIDKFKYNGGTIMTVFSVLVILSSFANLGNIYGAVSVAAFLLLYFQIIPINIFGNLVPTNLTQLGSYEQAKKTCPEPEEIKEKRSLLARLFGFGKKGGMGMGMGPTVNGGEEPVYRGGGSGRGNGGINLNDDVKKIVKNINKILKNK